MNCRIYDNFDGLAVLAQNDKRSTYLNMATKEEARRILAFTQEVLKMQKEEDRRKARRKQRDKLK